MNSHLDLYSNPMPNESAHLSHGHAHLPDDQSHTHLSDDQIDDQLIGDLAAGPAAHLAACSVCTDRVAAAAAPMSNFSNVTMAWSERRSATLPIPDLSQQKPLWQRRMAGAVATACFAIAIIIALTNASHQVAIKTAELEPMQQESTQQEPAQQTAPPATVLTETASVAFPPRAAQISADNQMLQSIDDELDASADSPAALGIEPVSDHPGRPPTTTSVQD
jgi:hypothetical protein